MIRRLSVLPVWVVLLLGALLVIIIGFIFSSLNPWNPLNYFGQPPVVIDISRATVIKQIQSLNRLETAAYTMDKIIEAGSDGNVFQNLLYGDKILLVAHGKVVAGVNMAKVDADQVKVNGTTLAMTLPPAEVFSTTLDNDQTKVFDRQLGLLSKGNKDLETKARQAAESSLYRAACDGGILVEAAKNARERLVQNYALVGFISVDITVPSGTC